MEYQLSELDLQLIHLYRQLSPEDKELVSAMAATMAASHQGLEKPAE